MDSNSPVGPPPTGDTVADGGSGRTQPLAPVPLGRSVPEWIGKHPDQKVPDHVRLRIFDRYEGRCYLSGAKIRAGDAWELEHIIALTLGGEHRESNLAPALVEHHKAKTAQDRRKKKKSDRVRRKHFGMHRAKYPMHGGRKSREKKTIDGRVIDRVTGEQIWPRIHS